MLKSLPKSIKVFAFFFPLFFLARIFIAPAFALPESYDSWRGATSGEDPDYTQEDNIEGSVNGIVYSLGDLIVGTPETVGAVEGASRVVSFMITSPPVRTNEYLADLGSNLGLPIKSAYAQGVGWQALSPILDVWKAFRNIAYMAFVIIFIAIGFMIMFRAKINPQTVITIQSALPKIIITLLIITFSYAIAGLMIDLIYILIYLIVGVFSLGGLIEPGRGQDVISALLSQSPYKIIYIRGQNFLVHGPAQGIQDLVGGLIGSDWDDTKLNLAGGLVKLVLGITVFFSIIKLLFSLLMSYLGIILGVIFSPFSLLFNALPGTNALTNWLKSMFANIIVFPAIAGMFLLAAVMIGPHEDANPFFIRDGIGFNPSTGGTASETWMPPFIVTIEEGDPGIKPGAFQALIALGMITMMPKIAGQIKKMMKIEPSGFGGAIMGGIMAGPGALMAAPQTGWNLMYQYGMLRNTLKRPDTAYVQPTQTTQVEPK
jgi:hypothetical protein